MSSEPTNPAAICPRGCGPMFRGERLWVCGWCGGHAPGTEIRPESEPLPRMLHVPGGEFFMGAPEEDPDAAPGERPLRAVQLPEFWIAETPITNAQYERFVLATGRQSPAHWRYRPPLGENRQHPVCFVSWFDATAFCEWLTSFTRTRYHLPSEAQWEKAARGGIWLDGDTQRERANPAPQRLYPWGPHPPTENHANHDGVVGCTTPVGSYPLGRGPYGALDQAGNVSEFTRESDGEMCVLKGGSWRSEASHIRCSNRYRFRCNRPNYGIGFRIAAETEPGE